MPAPVLVPVLGDQLSFQLASLRELDPAASVILMVEAMEEATYVKHHKQKLVLVFSAMRHFAAELREAGFLVDYIGLTDPANTGSLTAELGRAVRRHAPAQIRVVEAGEWRVQQAIEQWEARFSCPVRILPDDRSLCSIAEFRAWAKGRRQLTMETFYRQMRRRTGLLMEGGKGGGQPVGGAWNFDSHNREALTREALTREAPIPPRRNFAPDAITREVIALVEERFADHFGSLERFGWPVTRQEAQAAADDFFSCRLAAFGPYQDAMLDGEDQLYHSLLSASLNLGLLEPMDLCRRAEQAYREGRAPLRSVEGFVRQILGWREYVRGFYWAGMPDLASANALGATRPLPEFYWTGKTDMRCLAEAIRNTAQNAYAHHIQRLMVLGNFALLAGLAPQEVAQWYLAVYADAYEWVELPNVAAMALYADGGRMATKPYAASGNYIRKMSDHCRLCAYNVAQKTGEGACPFNALYWHFLQTHRQRLEGNHRLGQIYANWDRQGPEKQRASLASAEAFLAGLKPARQGWARALEKGPLREG